MIYDCHSLNRQVATLATYRPIHDYKQGETDAICGGHQNKVPCHCVLSHRGLHTKLKANSFVGLHCRITVRNSCILINASMTITIVVRFRCISQLHPITGLGNMLSHTRTSKPSLGESLTIVC